jgi:hypothetical protein
MYDLKFSRFFGEFGYNAIKNIIDGFYLHHTTLLNNLSNFVEIQLLKYNTPFSDVSIFYNNFGDKHYIELSWYDRNNNKVFFNIYDSYIMFLSMEDMVDHVLYDYDLETHHIWKTDTKSKRFIVFEVSYIIKELFYDETNDNNDGLFNYTSVGIYCSLDELTTLVNNFQTKYPELELFKLNCCSFECRLKDTNFMNRDKLEYYLKEFVDYLKLETENANIVDKSIVFYGQDGQDE